MKLHKRLRFDGAQTQLLVLALQLLDATLLFVDGGREWLVLRNRPTSQAAIALQVAALVQPSPVGQMGGVQPLAPQQRRHLAALRACVGLLDDRALVLDAEHPPLGARLDDRCISMPPVQT